MIRPPVVSGRFYPKDPVELRAVVSTLLADARRPHPLTPSPPAERGNVSAAIVPHAGYLYSGPTAAQVFVRITTPGLVVILAPNHTGVCEAESGVSLWETGAFRTPLGEVPIDAAAAQALRELSNGLVEIDHDAHRGEHAIEVELPFLQLARADVRIVPLVIAWDEWRPARALGEALMPLVIAWDEWRPARALGAALTRLVRASGEPILLLASSDLNHYESAAVSEKKDAMALDAIRALDGEALLASCKRERISMCGRGPSAVLLCAARDLGANRAEVVDYRHSGWVSGDNERVVGYAGVVIS